MVARSAHSPTSAKTGMISSPARVVRIDRVRAGVGRCRLAMGPPRGTTIAIFDQRVVFSELSISRYRKVGFTWRLTGELRSGHATSLTAAAGFAADIAAGGQHFLLAGRAFVMPAERSARSARNRFWTAALVVA